MAIIFPRHHEVRPHLTTGFARSRVESAAPALWRGLWGMWAPFVGQTGATLLDYSGWMRHADFYNMDVPTDWVRGAMGPVPTFDGTNDYAQAAINPAIGTGAFAVMAFVRTPVSDSGETCAIGCKVSNTGFMLGRDANDPFLWVNNQIATITKDLTDGEWHQLHGCRCAGASTANLFVDGAWVDDVTHSLVDNTVTSATPLTIGCSEPGVEGWFLGEIAFAALWNRVLTPGEVFDLWQDPYIMLRARPLILPRPVELPGNVHNRTPDETLALSDATSQKVVWKRSIADTLGLSESLSRKAVAKRSIADDLGASDAEQHGTAAPATISEDLALSESVDAATESRRSRSDDLGMADAVALGTAKPQSMSDTAALSDAASRATEWRRSLVDTLGASEDVTATLGAQSYNRTVVESLALSESIETTEIYNRVSADTSALSESVDHKEESRRSAVEGLGLSDAAPRAVEWRKSLSDTLGMSEHVTATLGAQPHNRTVTESLGLSESVSTEEVYKRTCTDTLAFSESVASKVETRRQVAETLALSDDVQSQVGAQSHDRTVTETLALSDSVTSSLAGVETAYALRLHSYPSIPSYSSDFARCAEESANPQLWDGLVGAWVPMLGRTGEKLPDLSRQLHDGTLVNMNVPTCWTARKKGWALDFDATNDYVDLDLPNLSTKRYTIATSFRRTSSPTLMYILSAWISGSTDERLNLVLVNDSDRLRMLDDFGLDILGLTGFIKLDVWYDVVVTYDFTAQFAAIYLDGQPHAVEADASFNEASSETLGRCYLGTRSNISWHFGGDIQYCYIWDDRVLQRDEISHLHADPHALFRQRPLILPVTAVAAGESHERTISETIGLSDAILDKEQSRRSISDTLALSEDVTATLGAQSYDRTVTETLGISDTVVHKEQSRRSIADSLVLSESCDTRSIYNRTYVDTLSFSESVGIKEIYKRTRVDTFGLSDDLQSQVGAQSYDRTITETLGLSDSAATKSALYRSVADTLVFSDSTSTASVFHRTLIDTLGMSVGSVTLRRQIDVQLSPVTIGLSDDVQSALGAQAHNRTPTENLALSDAAVQKEIYNRLTVDTFGMSDAVQSAVSGPTNRTVVENLALSDSIETAVVSRRTLTETLAVSDSVSSSIPGIETAFALREYSRPAVPSYSAAIARYAEESAHPELWDGLVGVWTPMLGRTGELLPDLLQNNDGRHTGQLNWLTSPIGYCLKHDDDQYVTFNRRFTDEISDQCSIVWSGYPLTLTADIRRFFVGQYSPTASDYSWGFYIGSSPYRVLFYLYTSAGYNVASINNLSIGILSTVVGTYDGAQIKIYFNGNEEDSTAVQGDVLDDYDFKLGHTWSTTAYADVATAFLATYDRPLNPSEIRHLHADPHALFRQRPLILPVTTIPAGQSHDRTITDTLAFSTPSLSTRSDRSYQIDAVTVGLTDAVTTQIVGQHDRSIADTLTFSETALTAVLYSRTLVDTLGTSDAIVFVSQHQRTITENLGVSEDVTAALGAQSYSRTATESLGISDAIVHKEESRRGIADTFSLSDAVETEIVRHRIYSDTLGLSDAFEPKIVYHRTIVDTLGLSDAIITQVAGQHQRTITENLGISDAVTTQVTGQHQQTITENLGISDAVLVRVESRRSMSDTMTFATPSLAHRQGHSRLIDAVTLALSDLHLKKQPAMRVLSDTLILDIGPIGAGREQPHLLDPITLGLSDNLIVIALGPDSGLVIDTFGLSDSVIASNKARIITDTLALIDRAPSSTFCEPGDSTWDQDGPGDSTWVPSGPGGATVIRKRSR